MKKRSLAVGRILALSILSSLAAARAFGQFMDNFNGPSIVKDPSGNSGWALEKGSGNVSIGLEQGDGCGVIRVDATQDKLNVWWALIKRRVSEQMDLGLLADPKYDLRVEARVRASRAPRRFNIRLQTQRTTDFHINLMEFDIADTVSWHTVSLTTRDFDGKPGDAVYVTLALIDWGLDVYRLDVDYMRVDLVQADSVGPDLGVQVPYHPAVPDIGVFTEHVPVARDGMIDSDFTAWRFNNWSGEDETGKTTLLATGGSQFVIMSWDFGPYAGRKISGSGLLQLTSYEAERNPDYSSDFGMVRVVEILGGDAEWDQKRVTYDSFCKDRPLDQILNEQMIIDFYAAEKRDSVNLLTIPNPVLQRMIDGKTLGLALRPLGAVHASFYALEKGDVYCPRLHFTVDSASAGYPDQSSTIVPGKARLEQNYPNPFNPDTVMKYALAKPADVRLAIYDVRGRRIRTLLSGRQEAGEHALSWDGRDDAGRRMGSGIYFYELRSDQFEMQKKMMVLR